MNTKRVKIFLVDDDALFLKSLEIEFLDSGSFEIETFATGELCIAALPAAPDIIVLDYHLDGLDKYAINGISTLDKIKEFNPAIQVIMLSSQDKIEVAIECMHHQAFDYVVKSETAFHHLKKTINTIYRLTKMQKELNWYMERM